ncbi:MAG: sensor histidine kinase [Bacteriovoracia bacterium]
MLGFDRKLLSALFLLMLLFVPLLAGALYSLRKVVSDQDELISIYAEELLLARDLRRYVSEQNAAMPVYVLTGDPAVLRNFEEAHLNFLSTLTALEKMANESASRPMLEQIRRAQESLHAKAAPGIALKKKGQSVKKVNAYFRSVSGSGALSLSEKLDDFVRFTTDAYEKEKSGNIRTSRRIVRIIGIASALSIFFALLVGALLLNLIRQRRSYDQTMRLLASKESQLSNARKEIVEVVAHDLKNPLASIKMNTQIALRKIEGDPDKGDIKKSLEANLKSANSMHRLIDELLDHAKIESGTFSLRKTEVRLESFLKNIAERFLPLAQAKKIRLEFDVSEKIPPATIDEGRMEQVVSNLVGNALKFTPPDGKIQLTARFKTEEFLLSVTDTGSGMTREQTQHVFDRYWQVRETASQGTGLGLTISKAIVKAHGGRIWVESEPGIGSAFYVSLPNRST